MPGNVHEGFNGPQKGFWKGSLRKAVKRFGHPYTFNKVINPLA